MRSYFTLQGKMIHRHFIDFGLHPFMGYLLLAIVFSGFTTYLFYNSAYAVYAYTFISLGLSTLLSEGGRVAFLKQHFTTPDFKKIRIVENLILALPFSIGLVFNSEWLMACAVFFLSGLLSFTSFENKLNITLPTPFYKYPYEFTTGFRKNYLLLIFAAFLLTMAVMYENANLGLFAVALVLLVCLIYYMASEIHYLVWIHALSPSEFLLHKIRIALLYTALSVLPFAIVFMFFFPSHIGYLAMIYGLGMLYIVQAILGKYAFFPASINLLQGFMVAFSFWFPPLLLFLIPYFYIRSIKKLKPILQ